MVDMGTYCILHLIHVAGTRMKLLVIDGLSRGDILEGMMNGQNPLDFIPMNESDDNRSGGRVVSCITYWWKYRTGEAWGGCALKKLAPGGWFQLHTQDRPIHWTPPPAVMETVVGLFNEDRLAHPHTPHVFSIPRLMTHLWMKHLSKEVHVLLIVNVGPSFWPCSMHKPLIVLIFLNMAHVSNYRGPWVLQGSYKTLEVQDHLEAGFKYPEIHGCGKFHDLEGPVHEVRDRKDEWSRAILFKFIEAHKTFPPVLCGLVRIIYCPHL